LTDFGLSDPYVGVMKGVIAARCPEVHLIDITHQVSPQNFRQAAYLLRTAYRFFPTHTVFLAVVDPGVGTDRRPVAFQTSHGQFVGPDNGLFSAVLDEVTLLGAVKLHLPDSVALSGTFHGRDVFAPAAAALARAMPLSELGIPIHDLTRLGPPRAERMSPMLLMGDVIHIDHFGNIVTSLGPFVWRESGRIVALEGRGGKLPPMFIEAATARIVCRDHVITGIQTTYGMTRPGDLLALINSDCQLEIAQNQGNAARRLDARLGDPLELHFRGHDLGEDALRSR
jgi:S-adenosylmethionine hydrolase